VLSNLDGHATAGARTEAVAHTLAAAANSSGPIVCEPVTVIENAAIAGIESIRAPRSVASGPAERACGGARAVRGGDEQRLAAATSRR
jgi:hypothetical protein